MADSYRLAALKALCTHLEGISAADGYNYTLAGKVFRGKTLFGSEDPKPMLSILESPRPESGVHAGENRLERAEQWPLLIQGWAVDDKANPSDPLYGLLDDVEVRLQRIVDISPSTGYPRYPAEYMLGNKINSLVFGPGVVRPPTEGVNGTSFMYLPIRVGLVRSSR